MGNLFTTFTNCRLCIDGKLVEDERLVVSQDSGEILKSTGYIGGDIIDLDGAIVAPGFLDVTAKGDKSFTFADALKEAEHEAWSQALSAQYASQGVTGFWATVPYSSSSPEVLEKIAKTSSTKTATLLGIHLDSIPASTSEPAHQELPSPIIKLATIDIHNIPSITHYSTASTRVAMTSSTASYADAESALYAGATAISHPLSSTKALSGDDPGPVGLLALHDRLAPYFFLPCNVNTLHAKAAVLLFRASPLRAILCGGEGVTLDQAVRNMYYWSGCDIAEAVRAVTENVADFMGLTDRGRLKVGQRADFVVLDDGGNVKQVWIAGSRVWPEGFEDEDEEYF